MVPLENESLEFDDGSFTADIPRKRLSELFHVTQDIVSQVNPHVAMMIGSDSGERFSLFRASFRAISSDVLQRLRFLAKLNLLPAMFGSVSISTTGDMMMAQRYTGDVTILPRVGGPRAFLNSIQNPDRPQMRSFIREGMKAANVALKMAHKNVSLDEVEDMQDDLEDMLEEADEIQQITQLYDFDEVYRLNFPTAQLDMIPMSDLVSAMSDAFKTFQPEEVFMPHPADVHTDHRFVFDAVSACVKWFRFPSVKRVLAYETLSETDFSLGTDQAFRPNVFVDIENFLSEKLRAIDIYASEVSEFPFPRSHEAIQSLAKLRGAASGFKSAEAFELLRERS